MAFQSAATATPLPLDVGTAIETPATKPTAPKKETWFTGANVLGTILTVSGLTIMMMVTSSLSYQRCPKK